MLTISVLRRLMLVLILSVGICATLPAQAHRPAAPNQARPPVVPQTQSNAPHNPIAEPIPAGCIGVTPPGEPEAPCCISGYVLIDGQVAAEAQVQIQNTRGDQITTFTQIYSTTQSAAHYRLNLNADPLNVTVGETITITARYSSHITTLAYIVQDGGQQVDVVLNRNYTSDYLYERKIWYQDDPNTFLYPQGIAISDDLGRVYIADSDNDRIQVFTKSGQFIKQWGSVGNAPGKFSQPRNMTIDSNNNVYVVDAGNHRIQKFDADGNFITMWGGRGAAKGQFEYLSGIAINQSHVIYTLELSGRVQSFTSTGQSLAAWFASQSTTTAYFRGIAVDSTNVYIGDQNQKRIMKLSYSGILLNTWGTSGNANGQFEEITDVHLDRDGNIFIPDWWNQRVQKFTTNGEWLDSFGENGAGNGETISIWTVAVDTSGDIYMLDGHKIHKFTSDGGWITTWGSLTPSNQSISSPEGMAIDTNGNIYVVDSGRNRIQKYASDGTFIMNWGSFGSGNGQFNYPNGIGIDSVNNIYIVDTYNYRIQKFTSNGTWLSSWGSRGIGNGQFDRPQGIAIDTNGDFYVTEGDTFVETTENHRVQKFDRFGNFIRSWGVLGTGNGQFEAPKGIAIGSDGLVYVVDSGFFAESANNRIQKFTKAGQWVDTWGSYSTLGRPSWIALDSQNNVILPNFWNGAVQIFTSQGLLLSSFGRHGLAEGEFDYPKGVARTANGRIYVADDRHGRIQIFRPMIYTKPVATINYLSSESLHWDETLIARGIGQDSDQTPNIEGYEWKSDRDGVLATTPMLNRTASSLTPGSHRLSFRVRDREGEWSEPAIKMIYIAPASQAKWTMLLYLVGDYHDRGSQLGYFNRAITALRTSFHNPYLRIAIQIDGPTSNDTRRILITADNNASMPLVIETNIAEQAMDQSTTLADFLRWGQTTFPADNYYLSIANHGQAVQGIAWDTTSDLADDGTENDSAYLTIQELGSALKSPNVAPIDLLHLDACSMNLLETAYEIRENTNILLASQYLSWSFFAYNDYVSVFGANTTASNVAIGIAQRYAFLAQSNNYPYTISALDLSRAPTTLVAVDNLASELEALVKHNESYRPILNNIWLNSQKFESNGDYLITPSDVYIDLVDWTSRIQIGISSPAVKEHAAALLSELTGTQPFILINQARSALLPPQYGNGAYIDLSDSHGLSIFYGQSPHSSVYNNYINNRLFSFTRDSRWPDFLIAGVGASPPGNQIPPSGPLPVLSPEQKVFVPLVIK